MTMKQLVKNLGDQFNLPVTSVQNLDLDSFVDNAIKASNSFFAGISNYRIISCRGFFAKNSFAF